MRTVIISFFFLVLPLIAQAAVGSFQELLTAFGSIIAKLIPLAVGVALLFFFWGVAKTIRGADNENTVAEGKRIMLWGIIALFVMVSIWGIVKFLIMGVFGVTNLSPYLFYP
jgi:hypothetical protein